MTLGTIKDTVINLTTGWHGEIIKERDANNKGKRYGKNILVKYLDMPDTCKAANNGKDTFWESKRNLQRY